MIIVRIWEGLGNQLFQYAYARALQERTGRKVYLDIRHVNRGDLPFEKEDIVKRKLGLQNFKITLKGVATAKIPSLRCLDGSSQIRKAEYIFMKKGKWIWKYVDDECRIGQLCQDIYNPKDDTYVNAHCLNKSYYEDIRRILLNELKLNKRIVLNHTLDDMLKSKNVVSIHIRLTDYLRTPKVICSQEYYDQAINYIKERVPNPCFIVFSDNPHMAKARYHFTGDVYWVEKDEIKDYEALTIMSWCKHNIIAFSTFSYWGAWLNQNAEKIVVASRIWSRGNMYDKDWKLL